MLSLINRSIKATKLQGHGRKIRKMQGQGQQSPNWEVFILVAQHLEPKDLAIASCVCKRWYVSMASDHIWQPICTAHYPSISNLIKLSDPSLSYHRLYAIAHVAADRRLKTPSLPRLSLDDLILDIHIYVVSSTKKKKNNNDDDDDGNGFNGLHLAKPVNEIESRDENGVFRFDIGVNNCGCYLRPETQERVKITWNVALRGWRAVFTLMDCEGKVGPAAAQGWFSEELPPWPGCCLSNFNASSGISADVKLGFCNNNDRGGGGGVKVDKVSVGMLNTWNWRYVSVDDALRYLQEFLLPCNSNSNSNSAN